MSGGELPAGPHTLYVLRLDGGRYYVGVAEDSTWERIKSHFNGSGAAWTRQHPPVDVHAVVPGVSKRAERRKTLELMRREGWENVRGGGWTRCDMENPPKPLR